MFTDTPAEPLISASVLTLISKGPNGGFRPIAIGEVIANIGRSIIARDFAKALPSEFPLELGNGTSGGADAMAHGIAVELKRNPSHASASLDCTNAFNSITRAAMHEGVRRYAPHLLPAFRVMYDKPSVGYVPLCDGSHGCISISRGVRQGDSLGPAFFILGILPALVKSREIFQSVTIRSFYDDINITGPPNDVLRALQYLRDLLARIGLELNPGKSKILAPQGLGDSTAAFAAEGLPTAKSSMELLGTIIGVESEILEFLERKERDYLEALELIQLGITKGFRRQVAFKIVRYCASTRHLHLLRTIPPHLTKEFASRIDEHSANTIFDLCRGFFAKDQPVERPTNLLTCDKLIFLPLRLGGLAIPQVSVLRFSEFVSAFRKSATTNLPYIDNFDTLLTSYLNVFPHLDNACTELATLMNGTKEEIDDLVRTGANNLGSALANNVHEATERTLAQGMTTQSKIGHRSSCLVEAGSPFWLTYDFPSRLDDHPFIFCLLMRIGFTFHPIRDVCKLCNKPADKSGYHDLACTAPTEARSTVRHSLAQRAFVEYVQRSSQIDKVKFKLDSTQPNYSDFGERLLTATAARAANTNPAQTPHNFRICHPDIKITHCSTSTLTNGENILIDFTVAGLNDQSAQKAVNESGALAACAEDRKIAEVKRFWKLNNGVRFLPYAVEVTGGHGQMSRRFLYELHDIPNPPSALLEESIAQRVRDSRDAKFQSINRCKAAITAAIWIGNHHIYQAYASSLRAKEALEGDGHDTAVQLQEEDEE